MPSSLPMTTLGRTGLQVTRLGIGGAYCKTPDGYRAALDCGITYVDTARAYHFGEDERVLGQALVGRRHGLVLATKTEKRDAIGARAELETSLGLLGTDYIDVWQMHYVNSKPDLERILAPGGAMEAVTRAREQGLVRFVGVTGHNWEIVAKAVDTGLFDTSLCWYNCAMKEPETTVFPAAQRHQTGVAIMSATRGDLLLQAEEPLPLAGFYRYVLAAPAVSVVLMGLRDPERLKRVAQELSVQSMMEDPDERRVYEAYGARLRAAGKLDF